MKEKHAISVPAVDNISVKYYYNILRLVNRN